MYKFLGFILALIAVNNIITVTPDIPSLIYYMVFGAVFIIGLVKQAPKINGLLTFFVIAILISLMGNIIPVYFKAEERFISFLLVFSMLSPWVFNQALSEIRNYLFKYANGLLIFVILVSFLGNVTGIFSGVDKASLYQGLTSHSMLMGPISSVMLLIAIWQAIQPNTPRKKVIQYIVFAVICLYSVLISGSRGALLGGLLAATVFLFLVYKNNFIKTIKVFSIVVVLVVVTNPLWVPYTASIESKMEYAENMDDNFASRTELWNYRYQEFQSSPIIGIGFASAHKGAINTTNGQIEPGTSWGVLFSQLGVLGAIPIILLFISYFRKLFRVEDVFNIGNLLFAMLLFFSVHMVVEGYILGSGSFLFFYVWLLLGVIKNRVENKIVLIS